MFLFQRWSASKRVVRSLKCYRNLKPEQKEYLPEFEINCEKVLKCIEANYEVLTKITEGVEDMFENAQHSTVG